MSDNLSLLWKQAMDLTQTLQQWKDAILLVYIRKLTGEQIWPPLLLKNKIN